MMRFLVLFLFVFLLLSSFSSSVSGLTEEELKIAFVYNFLKFVSWPSGSKNLYLCVVGETKLKPYLFALQGKSVKDKVISVKELSLDVKGALCCNALFVGKLSRDKLKMIIRKAQENGVFTVSDLPGFAELGGIIEVFPVENKLRFIVNLSAAKLSGIKISSRLLKLAIRVINDDKS